MGGKGGQITDKCLTEGALTLRPWSSQPETRLLIVRLCPIHPITHFYFGWSTLSSSDFRRAIFVDLDSRSFRSLELKKGRA
jgi:hypothetical protein